MANKKKVIELIAAIKTIYPYYAKDTEKGILVNTWNLLLKDYADNAVETALLECLKTCKTPPTPADVIAQLKEFEKLNRVSDEELWQELNTALDETEKLAYCFNFTFVEDNGLTQGQIARNHFSKLWNSLSAELKSYLGSKSELLNMANHYTSKDMQFEKGRFLKTLPAIRKQQEYRALALPLPAKGGKPALGEVSV